MIHPYNDAERFEEIAQVYLGGYSWGIACVWRDKTTGRLYGDTDSGCSCYGPFDEAELEVVDGVMGRLIDITCEREAAALLDGVSGEDEPEPSTTQRQDFVREVGRALQGRS